jgi:UDP-N-acetylmuramoylalanine--D-glutamate ligase
LSDRPPLPEGPYLIVGLARSGVAAARMLRAHGEVLAADSGHPELPDDIEARLGSDGLDLVERAACVVKSPGVPNEAPAIARARERGVPVMGELELAWRLLPNGFVAVTGTNGKTTTVELLGEMWRAAGRPVAVAGNVGTPLSSLVGQVQPDATIVCEVSSFQAEDAAEFAPDIAVLLNLTPDHLDRHGSFEAYRDAKLRVFARQTPDQVAIAPAGLRLPGEGRWVPPGQLPLPVDEIRLRGPHNLENARAATAAARAGGVPEAAVAEALRTFAGVPHRLEQVATIEGVLFVNDSKATNVSSAARGIESFDGGVHAILGGSLKGGGFEGLREPVAARCRACYLVGEAADRLAADLADAGVPLHRCGALEGAVAAARAAAAPGEVVLLSPACASYDQFRDYEQRGDRFRALISPE